MIENLAVVTARQAGNVSLGAASASGCARCDAGKGCGGGIFGKLIARRLQGFQLPDPDLNLQPGQYVVLGLQEGVFLRATLITYGFPLLALFVFAAVAQAIAWTDAGVALAGLCGLGLGLALSPRLRQRYVDAALNPRVLRRALPADMQVCGNV